MSRNERIRELIKSIGIIPEDEHYDVAELMVEEVAKVLVENGSPLNLTQVAILSENF